MSRCALVVVLVTLACDAAVVVARAPVALWSAMTMSKVSSKAHRRATSAVSAEVSDAAAVGGGKAAGLTAGGVTGDAAIGDAAIFCLACDGGTELGAFW